MKIPKKLICGGQIFSIVDKPKNATDDYLGLTKLADNEILLDRDVPLTLQESTLLHEMLEVINWQFELKMPHSVIQTVEAALYQILKVNRLLK